MRGQPVKVFVTCLYLFCIVNGNSLDSAINAISAITGALSLDVSSGTHMHRRFLTKQTVAIPSSTCKDQIDCSQHYTEYCIHDEYYFAEVFCAKYCGFCVSPSWHEWSNWLCDHGSAVFGCSMKRYRSCNTGHERDCTGRASEVKRCDNVTCIAHSWLEWSSWRCHHGNAVLPCSMDRYRSCNTGHERDCKGRASEVQKCDNVNCIAPSWHEWSNWLCDYGNAAFPCSMERHRSCNTGHDSDCTGPKSEMKRCDNVTCIEPFWKAWSGWECHYDGNSCFMRRLRNCSTGISGHCSGLGSEIRRCDNITCIEPYWQEWSAWKCDYSPQTCFMGRYRNCSTGNDSHCKTKHSGHLQLQRCDNVTCMEPFWQEWGSWHCRYSQATCSMERFRNCSTGAKSDCSVRTHWYILDIEVQPCDNRSCFVTRKQTALQSTDSTVTLTPTTTTPTLKPTTAATTTAKQIITTQELITTTAPSPKQKAITKSTPINTSTTGIPKLTTPTPPPKPTPTATTTPTPTQASTTYTQSTFSTFRTSKQITTTTTQKRMTSTLTTPKPTTAANTTTHKHRNEWSPWFYGPCSVTCGTGSQQWVRRCSSGNDKDCSGSPYKTEACHTTPCPVDGGWSNWQAWVVCSTTCGNGVRTRERLCDNPPPQHNGTPCHGDSNETSHCHLKECPHWGAYYEAVPCSVTCGIGVIHIQRNCSTGNNHDCTGSPYDEKPCTRPAC